MKYTKNFNFKKPEPLDTVNINDINESFDLLDTELKKQKDNNDTMLASETERIAKEKERLKNEENRVDEFTNIKKDYDTYKNIMIAESNVAALQDQVNKTNASLEQKANDSEVRKKSLKLELEDMSATALAAIQGGEVTSFNLLSIPQDTSVTPEKMASHSGLNMYPFHRKATLSNVPYALAAVKDVKLFGTDLNDSYTLDVLQRYINSQGARKNTIYIKNSAGDWVCRFDKTDYEEPLGIDKITLEAYQNSGVTGTIWIDWSKLSVGTRVNPSDFGKTGLDERTYIEDIRPLTKLDLRDADKNELSDEYVFRSLPNKVKDEIEDGKFIKRVSNDILIKGSNIGGYVEFENVGVVVFSLNLLPGVVAQTIGFDGSVVVDGKTETTEHRKDNITEIGKYYTNATQLGIVVAKGSYKSTTNARSNFSTIKVNYQLATPITILLPDNLSPNTKEILRLNDEVNNRVTTEDLLQTGDVTRGLRNYYIKNINDSLPKFWNTRDKDTLSFSVISDSHFEEIDEPTYMNVETTSALTEYYDLDFIVPLGDYIVGDLPKYNSMKLMHNTMDLLAKHCKRPMFPIKGNHDANDMPSQFTGRTNEEIRNLMITNKEYYKVITKRAEKFGIVTDPDNPYGSYYYVDFPQQKIRGIFLNTSEMIEGIDGKPMIDKWIWVGVEEEKQLKWLVNKALKIEEGWAVIMFSHIPPFAEEFMHNRGKINTNLTQLCRAFKNGTSGIMSNVRKNENGVNILAPQISYDFTMQGSREFIAHIHGHVHEDSYGLIDEINHFINNTTRPAKRWDTSLPRGLYDETSLSANVFVINRETRTVNVIKVGAGTDYEFTW